MKVETLAEQLLFATTRIEASPNVGTGFIISHKWAEDKSGPFLITNKHVVDGTKVGRLTFTVLDQDSADNRPLMGKTTSVNVSGTPWSWTGHPSKDVDVAALPLAPIVNHLREKGDTPFYKSIQTDIIPGQDALEDFDALEEIMFVGYPSGIYDSVNNLPITRRGSTATPLSIDYEGKPIFLIDASVFQGSSGSPVLIYDNGSWHSRDGGLMAGQRLFLLGVLGSVFYRETDGTLTYEEIPAAVQPVVKTNQMIELGVVYKARTIVETIEHLLRQRGELFSDAPTLAGNS